MGVAGFDFEPSTHTKFFYSLKGFYEKKKIGYDFLSREHENVIRDPHYFRMGFEETHEFCC